MTRQRLTIGEVLANHREEADAIGDPTPFEAYLRTRPMRGLFDPAKREAERLRSLRIPPRPEPPMGIPFGDRCWHTEG